MRARPAAVSARVSGSGIADGPDDEKAGLINGCVKLPHYSLLAHSQVLRLRFVEGCSWETAAPVIQDPIG
jgi:hypothetical protein